LKHWQYKKGLQDLGNGVFAYLQPDGSWGWSNAGLIVDGEASLLVDTLFDLNLTREMLRIMQDAAPQAKNIGVLVNTHANGDHCFGNQLVEGAEIIASEASAREMAEFTPQMLAHMMRMAPEMGETGRYLLDIFGMFDFEGITMPAPTKTFQDRLSLKVGDKPVDLIKVGPAHTKGDVLVLLPEERTIFTGDILFIDGTPIMWAGPVSNWIDACDRILAMDVTTVVPGHGPITGKDGVARVRDYLRYVFDQTRKRFDAGLTVEEAANDIALGDYAAWGEAERIVVNVDTLYREFRGDTTPSDIGALFTMMAKLAR